MVETTDFSWHASLCDVKMESGDTKYLPSFCGSKGCCCVVVRALRAGLATHSSPQSPLLSPSMFGLRCLSVEVRRRLVRF